MNYKQTMIEAYNDLVDANFHDEAEMLDPIMNLLREYVQESQLDEIAVKLVKIMMREMS